MVELGSASPGWPVGFDGATHGTLAGELSPFQQLMAAGTMEILHYVGWFKVGLAQQNQVMGSRVL